MIPTNRGEQSAESILDYCLYVSYALNRDRGATPEQFKRAGGFGDVDKLEARYQTERVVGRAKSRADLGICACGAFLLSEAEQRNGVCRECL